MQSPHLHRFAALLVSLGLRDAINLDGGGSATMVVNGAVVSGSSEDACEVKSPCPDSDKPVPCSTGTCVSDYVTCLRLVVEHEVAPAADAEADLAPSTSLEFELSKNGRKKQPHNRLRTSAWPKRRL